MDQRTDNLQQSIEETRQDIEETRASMTEKLELLEERVRETIDGTRTAVEDIVENVKGTVDETVEAVKETVDGAKSTMDNIVENVKGTMDDTVNMVKQSFDFRYQVEQRPWMMFGGAVLAGYMLGSLMRNESSAYQYEYDDEYDEERQPYAAALASGTSMYTVAGDEEYAERDKETGNGHTHPAHARKRRSWGSSLGQFQEEWNIIKSAALGTLMGTLKEMVRQNMPTVAPKLEEAINKASAKLGTEPIEPAESQQTGKDGPSYTETSSREHTSYSPTHTQEGREQSSRHQVR